MSEETHDAARSGPLGIVGTILVTFTFGLAYIVSFIASVPSACARLTSATTPNCLP